MNRNKKVFILGASSDIGIALIKIYLQHNYRIVAHYNNGSKAFFDLVKNNNKIKILKFNLTSNLKSTEKFLKNKNINACKVFINAAAFLEDIKYEKMTVNNLYQTLKINLVPGVMLTKILGQKMYKNNWGRIVHLSSIGVKFGGGESTFCYSLSKHGLEFFPKKIKTWVKKNVLVNTVRVGVTDTKIHKRLINKNLKKRIKLIPAQRMATTEEISKFVYNLGSDENSYITGQIISISGGE